MNKKIKKRVQVCTIVLVSVALIYTVHYLHNWFSYSKEQPYYPKICQTDSLITIGIIGDSWVSEKRKLDSLLQKELLGKGIESKVISAGHPGAKSKLIYQNLFKNEDEKYSSKFIIDNCPDYCVIIAGVNDAASQVGAGFYSYHIMLIIKTLLHYDIRPVIVELPEFGIEEVINEMNFIKRNRNKLYSTITNSGEINCIQTYRDDFQRELAKNNLKDSIIFIPFESICRNYIQCSNLYENSSHLSKEGSQKLIQTIGQKLSTIIERK